MAEGMYKQGIAEVQKAVALLDEARRKDWEGEGAGLETTLVHIKDKKAQVERLSGTEASLLSTHSLSP